MADYRVRRLGVAPCSEATYNNIVAREKLVASGKVAELKKFDDEQAKKAEARANKAKVENSAPEGGNE